ncbi:hypothetical protein A1O3_00899 [Capronia epimyces CBS 606.96]|uniref:tRNA(Ile)-lysidine synthetase n=1 Tax=Capronia epimyces CBS 606.96 TaxID=1182542 RepID=W9ZCY0_9EURO|nr:uncharacterized protein A1O3_00899 [Capronia epimyces CBS 606.96]EXJ92349.1 hypothetical protein A1O3_00899 [Capronia epimyces CBS 606.96]
MALAYLLKQIPKADLRLRLEPLAFIVNHNARTKSRKEAQFVARYLEKLDIQPVVLNMDWGKIPDPASLPDFEMQARKARYQLIATAAIRRNIHHLFLGHHQDDQVETILMRLIRNPNTSFLGLQGMSAHSAIPCCEAIRGAHEMERYERWPDWLRQFDDTMPEEVEDNDAINLGKQVTVSRPGGLQIHRPLLEFPKKRLVQTCQHNGIIYQNDKTNDDPTLTLRNAIRRLRTNHHGSGYDKRLPRALQAQSILQIGHRARNSTSSLVERGGEILRKIRVQSFDLRSGLMTIAVSKTFVAACEDDVEAGANALARLTSVVSYQSRDDVPTLVPQARLMEFLDAMRSSDATFLTIQKVLLEKLQVDRSGIDHDRVAWRLSRPPMRSSEAKLAHQNFPLNSPWTKTSLSSNSTCHPNVDSSSGVWSDWVLWDHRYWMRVRAQDPSSLSEICVRPYQESDAPYVVETLKKDSVEFHDTLAKAAPGKLRYTLPVLTYQGRISVFPTLNISIPKSRSQQSGPTVAQHPIREWEVSYKAMDQPFIQEQAKTIEWRNALVKRRRGA